MVVGMRGNAGGTSNQRRTGTVSFMGNVARRGIRYAVGAKGPTVGAGAAMRPAGLRPTRGFNPDSIEAYDKAILARGGKRIAAAVAAGYIGSGYMKRTKSGLPQGKVQGIYKY